MGRPFAPFMRTGIFFYRVQEKKELMTCPPYIPMEKEKAEQEQASRYFTHFAPATIKDVAYYFGWTQTYAKAIMKKLPLSDMRINGKDYFYLGALKSDYPDIPRCIFLAGFDQLMLGYQKSESIYLRQEHIRGIFNLAGIVMPSILLNGKVVGKWQKKNSKLTITLFKTITPEDRQSILQAAENLWNDIRKIEWK
jgi:hypothetical protein